MSPCGCIHFDFKIIINFNFIYSQFYFHLITFPFIFQFKKQKYITWPTLFITALAVWPKTVSVDTYNRNRKQYLSCVRGIMCAATVPDTTHSTNSWLEKGGWITSENSLLINKCHYDRCKQMKWSLLYCFHLAKWMGKFNLINSFNYSSRNATASDFVTKATFLNDYTQFDSILWCCCFYFACSEHFTRTN